MNKKFVTLTGTVPNDEFTSEHNVTLELDAKTLATLEKLHSHTTQLASCFNVPLASTSLFSVTDEVITIVDTDFERSTSSITLIVGSDRTFGLHIFIDDDSLYETEFIPF